jgi:hypothetical protein
MAGIGVASKIMRLFIWLRKQLVTLYFFLLKEELPDFFLPLFELGAISLLCVTPFWNV